MPAAPSPLRIGIIAGEASGDILGAGLIQALRKQHPNMQCEGIAGPRMIAAGCKALFPSESIAVMGLVEVLTHIKKIWQIRQQILKHFLHHPPDIFIGIDAPDFNLPIERLLKEQGIKTVHYNSPTVWAWRPKRIYKIAQAIDLMLTLFPFEAAIYEQHHIPVCFVGHTLADQIPLHSDKVAARKQLDLPLDVPIIALLPGSRSNEIEHLAEPFLHTALWCLDKKPSLKFITPMINTERKAEFISYVQKIAPNLPLTIYDGNSHAVMAAADVILLASGTATLEAALIKRPIVVAHRLAAMTYWLGKRLIKIKHFSLPNLLAGKEIVPEFIQSAVTPENIGPALLQRLESSASNDALISKYFSIHQQLKCDANHKAAAAILALINHP